MLIDEGGHPGRELAGFSGFLQADAYSGFAGLYTGNRVSEVACWAHFRRELFERHKQQPIALTTDLLGRIAQLYAVEAEIRGQPAEARRSIRQERSRPLVTALRAAFDDAWHRLAPKSLTAKAIRYGTKRWDAFTRFLDDGRLEIDNSEQRQQGVRGTACPANAERAIRPIAVGRKNWLFAGSDAGGERAAAIYSVIEMATMNGLESQAYIADVIARIAAGWPASRWDELTPWNWTAEPVPVSPISINRAA